MITERLKIRKFTNNDLRDLYSLLSDEDVIEDEVIYVMELEN